MSLALGLAPKLKPEIRLAQAVSEAEAGLPENQKAVFRGYKSQSCQSPPKPSDVMQLTAGIDSCAAGGKAGGRCVGPRLTNILHAVQQFADLGDLIVGKNQNIVACTIWALVRISLLVGTTALATLVHHELTP